MITSADLHGGGSGPPLPTKQRPVLLSKEALATPSEMKTPSTGKSGSAFSRECPEVPHALRNSMKTSQVLAIILALISLSLPACYAHKDHPDLEHHKIVVTSPKAKHVIITQQYVGQIH